jgi:uncharacterized protein (TIGR02145 family)
MKKNLLLMMMCCPMVLVAQNGVTVSGLAVDAGTVTFNASWQTPMPVELWSDTVWVFVDYNKNGVMERLPVTSATASAGTVTKIPNNDKGVWIAGNARNTGSFSATVRLFTTVSNVGGACAYASNYPPVGEYSSDAPMLLFTGTPMYDIQLAKPGGGSVTVKSGDTFLLPCDYTVTSFSDATGAPGSITGGIPGIHQPQGNCTYTEPAVVGTFANFNPNYSAATYVSLVDGRDNKIYPVLKMGNRWMMARNLNYQKGLKWQEYSNQPSTTSGRDLNLIGNFWCPGSGSTSTLTNCDVWGALYSWETAMLLDGYGTWTEVATYSTGAANTANAKLNQGRTAHSGTGTGGRGICPVNWHVPTDFEWGVFFDAVEGGSSTAHQTASGTGWFGTNAGKYSKSACTGTATDIAPLWADDANRGIDSYGFRVLPTGFRRSNGSDFTNRGVWTEIWTSSASSETTALYREFFNYQATAMRWSWPRSDGYTVRCIRD